MAAAEMTLTMFLRHSGPALEHVDTRDLRLHRRDGEDLYLKRADREEAERESLAAAGLMLARMLQRVPDANSMLVGVVADALPWSRFLPDADRDAFIGEFLGTIEASAQLESFAPVGTLLRQWKNTADVWANPAFRATLEAGIDEGSAVERPTSAG